jgi:xanthine dehydrogenase YagR molybdenum-binding subunit
VRRLSADRGGDRHLARLIKTEKEVEGRYETVWTLVDEDALEQWPAGPLTVVGREATRVDGLQRARGEARYTADLQLPGMLHTAVLRSPFARARVIALDVGPALAMPGVRLAVGPDDDDVLTTEPGYHGAPVAAVCADTLEQARAGVAAISVEWEELAPRLDAAEAIGAQELIGEDDYTRGDVERGFEEADGVVEATYRTQVVLHNALETHVSVCEWHGDELTAHVSTQWMWGIRAGLARALGMPEDKVRVVCEFMGGGFGAKMNARETALLAARLARRSGRPVKYQLSRREENLDAGNRNATVQKLRIGARTDGTLTAIDGDYVLPVGFDGWMASPAGPAQLLYACENVRTVARGAKVNTPPMKAFRAPGFVEGTFALECALDELAAKLGVDPLELRRRNYTETDPRDGTRFSDKRLDRAYDLAEPHWERRHEVRARSDERWRRGVGLATQIWYGGGGPPSYAWVRLGSDAHAHVVTAMQDIGTGTRTAMAMIAAEELGLPLERVSVQLGDTARGPYASISGGSSTLPSVGPAVRAAAADVRRQLLEIGAQRFDVDEHSLSLRAGRFVADDGESWPLEEVTSLLEEGQITGTGSRGPNPAGMRVLTFGVQIAEVAVDVETGEVRVERIAAIHDVGRIVNVLGARSQVEGGIVQALGHTLSEERLLDPDTGRVLTQTLDAYRMPTIADVPEIVCEFVDLPDANLTNLGSKGLGEPPIIPTAAAISNAIRDATGADVRSLPIDRRTMLDALSDVRRKAPSQEEPVGAG